MKETMEIINRLIQEAYASLEKAIGEYDKAEGDGASETAYGKMKFFHGKITALEEAKKEIRKNLNFLQIPYC